MVEVAERRRLEDSLLRARLSSLEGVAHHLGVLPGGRWLEQARAAADRRTVRQREERQRQPRRHTSPRPPLSVLSAGPQEQRPGWSCAR